MIPRPTTLEYSRHPSMIHHIWNIDHIFHSSTPSPIDQQPHIFRPGMLISPSAYHRIRSEVYQNEMMMIEKQQTLDSTLDRARQDEMQHLSELVLSQQPPNDHMIQWVLSQLNLPSISHIDEHHPPSVDIQSGVIAHHHRPYASYGHLNRATIAQECQFDLQRPSTTTYEANNKHLRLNAKSFAITAWTDVSKDLVFEHIKKEFGTENIQYICVSEEISELHHERHLHVQIILTSKVNRRKPFLDHITQSRCNYQVTRNDLAWNEYIKKDGNYIEFNEFKSTRVRGEKQWPSVSSQSSIAFTTDTDTTNRPLVPISRPSSTSTTTTTVRAQIEARRQYEKETVVNALQLAEINVHQAMDVMRHALPTKFLAHSTWYLSTFNYVHLRAQQQADRMGRQVDKEYVWPLSFPHCTQQLAQAMHRWIQHHFSRTKRAKCLILIGPTGTGKTSFALSLPGRVNYFKERWNLDHWSDYARYSVYDDIPWDDFSKLNYPNKKCLLTQNGKIHATDKYRGTREINVQQPAIVLLNPEDAGSLLTEPTTLQEQQLAMYWKERAFIYVMQQDEYFYKRAPAPPHEDDDGHRSGSSSMDTKDARLGELDEFDQMIHRYQQQQQKHHHDP